MNFYVNHFLLYVVDRDYSGIPETTVSLLFTDFMNHQFVPLERVILALLTQPFENQSLAKNLLRSLLFNEEAHRRADLFLSLNFPSHFDDPHLLVKLEQYVSNPVVKRGLERFSNIDHKNFKEVPKYFGDFCVRLGTMFVFVLERLIDLEWYDLYIKFIDIYGGLLQYQAAAIHRIFIFLHSRHQLGFLKESSMRIRTAKLVSRLPVTFSKEFKLFMEGSECLEYGNSNYFFNQLRLLAEGETIDYVSAYFSVSLITYFQNLPMKC